VADALTGSIAFQERWVDPLLGKVWSQALARTLHEGGIAVVVVLTLAILCAELRSQRPSLPRAAYVLGVSAMVLSALLARDPFLFIVVWSVQHWSVAMGLSSLAASGGAEAPGGGWRRLLAPINRRAWAVLLVLAVFSALLMPLMEVEAVSDEYVYADRLFGAAALWLRTSPWLAALLALGFATAFIHYLLDRAAFRFSSPEVRRAACGLLRVQTRSEPRNPRAA
jgi:hypothetical protein